MVQRSLALALLLVLVIGSAALVSNAFKMGRMSLAEIKEAVEALSPADLAQLAQFIRQRENLAWDHQIDADFAEEGRLRPVLDEVRENIRAGKLQDLP